jgi:hypothetical protein
LSADFAADLTVVGSLAGRYGLADVDLMRIAGALRLIETLQYKIRMIKEGNP